MHRSTPSRKHPDAARNREDEKELSSIVSARPIQPKREIELKDQMMWARQPDAESKDASNVSRYCCGMVDTEILQPCVPNADDEDSISRLECGCNVEEPASKRRLVEFRSSGVWGLYWGFTVDCGPVSEKSERRALRTTLLQCSTVILSSNTLVGSR